MNTPREGNVWMYEMNKHKPNIPQNKNKKC